MSRGRPPPSRPQKLEGMITNRNLRPYFFLWIEKNQHSQFLCQRQFRHPFNPNAVVVELMFARCACHTPCLFNRSTNDKLMRQHAVWGVTWKMALMSYFYQWLNASDWSVCKKLALSYFDRYQGVRSAKSFLENSEDLVEHSATSLFPSWSQM